VTSGSRSIPVWIMHYYSTVDDSQIACDVHFHYSEYIHVLGRQGYTCIARAGLSDSWSDAELFPGKKGPSLDFGCVIEQGN